MFREWLQRLPHRHIWYAGSALLLAIVVFGSFDILFGGSADYGSTEGGHFFLRHRFGLRVEVSAFAYWVSVCALWLVRVTAGWLFIVVLAYSVRKHFRR